MHTNDSDQPFPLHPGMNLFYQPSTPTEHAPDIVLVGCGGIAQHHLQAYVDAGLRVVGLVDIRQDAATELRDRFFPEAKVYSDHLQALDEAPAEVFDVAMHPHQRNAIIRDCLSSGRHVLSQKPFVLDLDEGQQLIEFAEKCGKRLAVNQNGRWAPHFSYMRSAVAAGLLGQTFAVRMTCDWDHTWVQGTAFEHVHDLILYDYAIHWFDMLRCLLPTANAHKVYASTCQAPGQPIRPDLLGQVLVEFDTAQATMSFDAMVRFASEERTYVAGTEGTVISCGSGNQDQQVQLSTSAGTYSPALTGKWFPDGFRGTMCEFLNSIAENRPSLIDAADNLKSLEICFAALRSVRTGTPQVPGSVRRLPEIQ